MFKTVILTVMVTLALTYLALSLFTNTVLATVGMVATTTEAMAELTASRQVLGQVKKRHRTKSKRLTKKFAKRSAARLTATAAGIIGAGGLLVYEVKQYCDDQEELLKESNLLFAEQEPFDWQRCQDEAEQELLLAYEKTKLSVMNAFKGWFGLARGGVTASPE